MSDDTPVLFEERAAADGKRIGIAILNAPRTLNGFSLRMAKLLDAQLRAWADDDGIALVVLQGAGDKAFCAGGDLHSLYQSMIATRDSERQTPNRHDEILRNGYAADFFEVEYRVDHRIHTFNKPVLCWGHGIVMGGGIGLMSGASHRVVSERSKLAFPEITVGLFPDVGGSWLLDRVPRGAGVFLALTGAPLNAGDAIYAGMADVHVPEARRDEVLAALQAQSWIDEPAQRRGQLDELLAAFAEPAEAGPLWRHADVIEAACTHDDLDAIVSALSALDAGEEAWLLSAQATLAAGSPGSARLGFELQRRARGMSLAEVYRLEYVTALHCAAHGDFAEGIRALLIDKDRRPRWNPADLAEATTAWAETFFIAPAWPDGTHPLADLAARTR